MRCMEIFFESAPGAQVIQFSNPVPTVILKVAARRINSEFLEILCS